MQRLCLGAAVGILTGIVGGFFAGLNRNVAEFLNPLVVFFNAISGIVWLPLMIGWLGIGTALAVFVIWNTVFFIVFQNTVLGVQLVPEVLEQGVRALGGGRIETIRSVILPGALPYILTGIRSGDIPLGSAISLFMLPILAVSAIFILRGVRKRGREIGA